MAKTTKSPKVVSIDELITDALIKAAHSVHPVKLMGKEGGLFASASGANKAAIAACFDPETPLLQSVGKQDRQELVVLAPAGLERVLPHLPPEKVGAVAKAVIVAAPLSVRAKLIQKVISQVPAAAGELNAILEETIAAEAAEAEARIRTAQQRRAEEHDTQQALQRALELIRQRQQARLKALQREWEAEGQDPEELLRLLPKPHRTTPDDGQKPRKRREDSSKDTAPPLKTQEEIDFRRQECDRLAAAWREAWDDGKHEAQDYLESAMWNILGFRMIGEVGAIVDFDARYHECDQPLMSGKVRVIRPGWLLKEPKGDYVALKAVVTTL
ncbi:MAG: hypothetical protein RMJ56_00985 [Gemmataceae bacterium]|nr:hypothetical protein [Gemmataceae bacterium]